jgi:hypothetical protein
MNNQDREKNYTASDDASGGDHDDQSTRARSAAQMDTSTRYWNG